MYKQTTLKYEIWHDDLFVWGCFGSEIPTVHARRSFCSGGWTTGVIPPDDSGKEREAQFCLLKAASHTWAFTSRYGGVDSAIASSVQTDWYTREVSEELRGWPIAKSYKCIWLGSRWHPEPSARQLDGRRNVWLSEAASLEYVRRVRRLKGLWWWWAFIWGYTFLRNDLEAVVSWTEPTGWSWWSTEICSSRLKPTTLWPTAVNGSWAKPTGCSRVEWSATSKYWSSLIAIWLSTATRAASWKFVDATEPSIYLWWARLNKSIAAFTNTTAVVPITNWWIGIGCSGSCYLWP